MTEDEKEGAFNLVGDPEDPELEEEVISEGDDLVDVAGQKFSKEHTGIQVPLLRNDRLDLE